ncbi:MAG TPA: YceI family protein [Streptosporangiaceae bacterium]|nr:YceI family protein [Streptosporangiaceae bacterium]
MAAPALRQQIRPSIWTVDPSQSTATFAVRSFASTVRGKIPINSATVQVGEDGTVVAVSAELNPAGFLTGNPRRDAHIRSADFFDAESYPTLTFSAAKVVAGSGGWTVDGKLVIKGAETPVRLTAEAGDITGDLALVRASGEVDRRAAGLTKLPNLVIGRTLKITLDVTFRRVS